MLDESDPDVYLTVRKLVMVSLMEVFKDTVPGYRIRLPTDSEKQTKVGNTYYFSYVWHTQSWR